MLLAPDCSTAVMDPFAAQLQLIVFCDVHDPLTGQPYAATRADRQKAEAYLVSPGIVATLPISGPEAEFFIFDDVRYESTMNSASYTIESEEGPWVSASSSPTAIPTPPARQGRLLPGAPGRRPIRHSRRDALDHGRYGPQSRKAPLTRWRPHSRARRRVRHPGQDRRQHAVYKYVVHNVANQYGKDRHLMPKPIKGDNGSGMHTHQSIWKGERPSFAGNLYADLRDRALLHRRII